MAAGRVPFARRSIDTLPSVLGRLNPDGPFADDRAPTQGASSGLPDVPGTRLTAPRTTDLVPEAVDAAILSGDDGIAEGAAGPALPSPRGLEITTEGLGAAAAVVVLGSAALAWWRREHAERAEADALGDHGPRRLSRPRRLAWSSSSSERSPGRGRQPRPGRARPGTTRVNDANDDRGAAGPRRAARSSRRPDRPTAPQRVTRRRETSPAAVTC